MTAESGQDRRPPRERFAGTEHDFDLREIATGLRDETAPVRDGMLRCGAPAAMTLTLTSPFTPTGRSWSGIAGEFKAYAVTSGFGPDGTSGVLATAPFQVDLPLSPCDGFQGDRTLAPGASIVTSLAWKAEIVPGVAALPGSVPFTIAFQHDPPPLPTPAPQPSGGGFLPQGGYTEMYRTLSVGGSLQVTGPAPAVISAGQAIDAMLADRGFATWLANQPRSSWANVNLFLANYAQATDVLPTGPAWDVELFRNPRSWAIGFVDPFAGTVRKISYCNVPCGR